MKRAIVTDIKELRKPCQEVLESEVKDIIQDLEDTLSECQNGVGLAANQIGINKKVAIIRYGKIKIDLINPKVISGDSEIPYREGCLSFPGAEIPTVRYNHIIILNDKKTFEYSYNIGIMVQHEVDHLYGLTMFDRINRR